MTSVATGYYDYEAWLSSYLPEQAILGFGPAKIRN